MGLPVLTRAHILPKEPWFLMKQLLLIGVLLLPVSAAEAKPPEIQCPGSNTVEMRYCAGQLWEQSTKQLRQKLGKDQFKQWQDATREACAKAYAPYKEGTIYPQLVVGCDDHLNRALLKEFQPLGN